MIENVLPRESLRPLCRRKFKRTESRTVAPTEVDALVADGWQAVKKNKSGIRIERSKPHGKDLEDRVWSLLYRMGFPTPVIIAVYPADVSNYELKGNTLEYSTDNKFGEIIDGQHRIEGLRASHNLAMFQLPVTLMFDLTEEEKAYVFSIINSKQMPVNKSLIYDLFDLASDRSPQKTSHDIARLFNSDELSPFRNRLKMLGKKETYDASLSQGSFVKYFMPHLSRNPSDDLIGIKTGKKLERDPSLPLRDYFIDKEDAVIYKVLLNYLKAIRDTFPGEWADSQKYILSKTTGYGALMRALFELTLKGKSAGNLDYDFFMQEARAFKQNLEKANLTLTSDDFPSNESEQGKLAKVFLGRP